MAYRTEGTSFGNGARSFSALEFACKLQQERIFVDTSEPVAFLSGQAARAYCACLGRMKFTVMILSGLSNSV